MRYPAAETAEKHARIVEHAARLFRERGFADVSVGEIMKETGLTHGPFYNHFASKEALMVESFRHCAAEAAQVASRQTPDAAGKAAYLAAYLHPGHRDAPGAGCPIGALAADVAREPGLRGAFTEHLRGTYERLAAHFPWSSRRHARRDAIATLSALVGALVLSRAVDDQALSDEILAQTLAALE